MTYPHRTHIEPPPSPEEAAAIVVALEVLRDERPETGIPVRSRWRLAGLFGHPVPPGMGLEGSLWSYSSWKGGL